MKGFFGYTRVSTAKQGERGVSLQEQKDAIDRYAQRYGLNIVEWFEERETAAKTGRSVFTRMMKLLACRKAQGVIIHKIDRSARNLKDWADLGNLIDQGIEVHFANESLDLHSRGGRLSADIQAVVAADYIRNLREETKKGFYGRIKQGLYPLPAPLGYLDKGKGKPKEVDPIAGSLVKKAFELYETGNYNLQSLRDEMHRLGLRNKRGGKLSINGLSIMLNNPFYMGLIRLRRSGETFPGIHQALITKIRFEKVQVILSGKIKNKGTYRDFLFRRLLTCRYCGHSLIGETQKGKNYYRCHTQPCVTKTIREETIEEMIRQAFSLICLNDSDLAYLRKKVTKLRQDWTIKRDNLVDTVSRNLGQLKSRMDRLTDAYLDGVLEKELFEERKLNLLMERRGLEESLSSLKDKKDSVPDRMEKFLELTKTLYYSYKTALSGEKRDLLKEVTSNRLIEAKKIEIKLDFPFQEVANYGILTNGSPFQETPRILLDELFQKLLTYFSTHE